MGRMIRIIVFSLFTVSNIYGADIVILSFEGTIDQYIDKSDSTIYEISEPVEFEIKFINEVTDYEEEIDYQRTYFGEPTFYIDFDFSAHQPNPSQRVITDGGFTNFTEQILAQNMEIMFRVSSASANWSADPIDITVQGLSLDAHSGQRTPQQFLDKLFEIKENHITFWIQAFTENFKHRGRDIKISNITVNELLSYVNDIDIDCDVDGTDLFNLVSAKAINLHELATDYGKTDCLN